VERLKEEFTVITVDIRGTGESDFLTDIGDYTIEKICADLNAVADACEIQGFAVWGFSFGGNGPVLNIVYKKKGDQDGENDRNHSQTV
jgi:pimeloyl-ACP methyl ester carboxylesterase